MRWISLGVLVAAGVVLALFWGDVPDRWATHWGLHGQVNGWATKSVGAAMLPLALGFVVWLVLEATAIWVARSGRGKAVPPEMMAVQATIVRAAGLGLSLLIGGLAVGLPLLRPRSSMPIVVGAWIDMGLVVGIAIAWAAWRVRRLRAAGVAMPEGYGGLVYRNPGDARLWVPKLVGAGWTINFAHRLAWPVLVALVGVPLALVLIVTLATAR